MGRFKRASLRRVVGVAVRHRMRSRMRRSNNSNSNNNATRDIKGICPVSGSVLYRKCISEVAAS